MAKYIPESNREWVKWLATVIAGAVVSAVIGYYVTEYLKQQKEKTL